MTDRMARGFQRFSLRFVLEATFAFAAGLAGSQSVYVGEANRWPGFQVREGYWGTHALDPLLYAIGSDVEVLRIVSVIWFCYAALMAIFLIVVARFCFGRRRST